MKYYKLPTTNEVFAYTDESEREEFGSVELVEMSQAEVEAHLNPPVDPEQLADDVRAERDRRLAATDRYALPDYPHADEETRQAWLDYRQELRDLPQAEGFPWQGVGDAPWPEEPEA